MNLSVCSKRRVTAFAAAIVGLAAFAGRVHAGLNPFITSRSQLSAYEDLIDPAHSGPPTNTVHRDSGTGALSYHYSTSGTQFGSVNTAAYVDPATGKMRAYAVSDASEFATAGVEPPFNAGPGNGRSGAGADVSYFKQIEVTAGTSGLSVGTPVSLTLTFHLDGRLSVGGYLPHNPLQVSSGAAMNAHFTIFDQAVLTEDGSIYEVVHFSAQAERSLYIFPPNGGNFPEGAQVRSKKYQWSLISNNPAEPAHKLFDQDYREDPYNFGTEGSGGTTTPVPFAHDFDTGVLVVTFDTYVGAILDIDAALAVSTFAAAGAKSPYAGANFMNTFALDFQPAAGFEGLALVSNAVVPEPASLSLLAFALPLMARRRAR